MPLADKTHLRIPGPTPIPPRVQWAMNQPMIGHRSGECSRLVVENSRRLQPVFGTDQPVLIVTGSGTSALEAAVVNAVAPGEEAAVVVTGAFGDRFAKIVTRYGITLRRLDIPWSEACQPEVLAEFLQQHPQVKAVFLTYCETSTGVLNPIRELARTVHQHSDALVIVDGVSCLGAVDCRMDEWGVDIMVTGSQKALMLPPGLAFIAVSDRAWEVIERNPRSRFYLDLIAYRDNLTKQTTPYTPAVSLLFGLKEVLNLIQEEGFSAIVARHRLMMEMSRAGIRALGLELLAPDAFASPTVTAVKGGGQLDVEAFRKELRQIGVVVAGGQQHLKGKIFRIGHMGYCDPLDVLTVFNAIELALFRLGVPVELGSAVKACEEVWANVSRTHHGSAQ
ncbi:class V aminotransferase [Polycladomyces abyssicola]|uniref:Class V aminotransferase n=1 Tax=Polycladomyces abyssicola TaxID=1125966 RepID=A0A8D5UE30_9BACL|nr:alanine--glyoxylate aminotransferase family protein [Polycladomyces abyssicola]BCU81731.1 class V aminotransferase [Polycladomyces abyssicola]